MKHQSHEIYADNNKLKAVLSHRSGAVVVVEIYKLNEGYISGHGDIHDPIWEIVAGPVFVDSIPRAQEVAKEEMKRFL